METKTVKCPICEHVREIRIVTMGQTVHRCKECGNLVKIAECEQKPKKEEKKAKKKTSKKTKKKSKKKAKKTDEK